MIYNHIFRLSSFRSIRTRKETLSWCALSVSLSFMHRHRHTYMYTSKSFFTDMVISVRYVYHFILWLLLWTWNSLGMKFVLTYVCFNSYPIPQKMASYLKDVSCLRQKGSSLERAIRELEKLVAECESVIFLGQYKFLPNDKYGPFS